MGQTDIQQALSDKAAKAVQATEDSKFLAAVCTVLAGANAADPTSDEIQCEAIAGGITRAAVQDALAAIRLNEGGGPYVEDHTTRSE
jgi:hypothetical protein